MPRAAACARRHEIVHEPADPDNRGGRAPVRHFWRVLWIGVILSGCLYVGQRWSPSSYAIVLQQFGVVDTGVVAGLPRVERGDEFAWQTPLLQMTVRSGFQRFDRTPPYFEDLRSLYGMPIRDLGARLQAAVLAVLRRPAGARVFVPTTSS